MAVYGARVWEAADWCDARQACHHSSTISPAVEV
jgi:hypothetical protein